MTTESATIVQRLWNYCNVLRDDGVSYGDYVEQLTYLLFLKMADEQEREFGKASAIPPEYSWASLRGLEGDEPERHYRAILADLGRRSGLITVIFRKARSRIKDPAKLRRIVAEVERRLSVLKQAFEGRLVEQDPEDEPASALLDRIQSEMHAKAGESKNIRQL